MDIKISAEGNAKEKVSEGIFYFMVVTHGWNPMEVPGIGIDRLKNCLPEDIEKMEYYQGSDIPRMETEEDTYSRHINNPEKTWLYAKSFNKVMFSYAKVSGISKCI